MRGGERGVCAYGGCRRPHKGHGFCSMHYQRWKNSGDPSAAKPKRVDISGQRFGRWTVTNHFRGKKPVEWLCVCICGKENWVQGGTLRNGGSLSCGCLCRDRHHAMATHGHTCNNRQSREFNSWHAMRARCGNPRATGYHLYGGRGISVCARWQRSFSAFLSDMGPRPLRTSLDRINPNGNYESSNCRWATPKEQQANRRDRRAA